MKRKIVIVAPAVLFAWFAVSWLLMLPPVCWPEQLRPLPCVCACINNLRQIESGKTEAAHEMHWTNGFAVVISNVNNYIKGLAGTTNMPQCPSGGAYSYGRVGVYPACSLQNVTPRRVRVSAFTYRWLPERDHMMVPREWLAIERK